MTRVRRKQKVFDPAAKRRREIERHARHVGAADTDDFWRWLVAWAWHNTTSKDQVGALENISEKMGRRLGPSEIDEILDVANTGRRACSADAVARFLGLTYKQRQRLKITTIGAIDVNKRGRSLLRQRRRRRYQERRRRARGAAPRAEWEANSKSRIKPWEQEGMTRRTWYRKRRGTVGTGPKPATPTRTEGGEIGTGPKPALLSSGRHGPVPPEGKQAASGGVGCRLRERRLADAAMDCCAS
jgi:hypothetical protein